LSHIPEIPQAVFYAFFLFLRENLVASLGRLAFLELLQNVVQHVRDVFIHVFEVCLIETALNTVN
jgi:hypothetical protein